MNEEKKHADQFLKSLTDEEIFELVKNKLLMYQAQIEEQKIQEEKK